MRPLDGWCILKGVVRIVTTEEQMFNVVFVSPAISIFFPFYSCFVECNEVELNACGHISLE